MDSSHGTPLALICSVSLEAEPVLRLLASPRPFALGGKPAVAGLLGDSPVVLLEAGMGKTNAAHGLTALLERHAVRGVIGFGVGGAYPGARLDTGGIALASSEVYGDEGVAAPGGWLSTEEIGIPLLERDAQRVFNHLRLDPARVEGARRALAAEGMEVEVGPFVTVSCCSGTLARGRELAERFAGVCESMEGAAYAHVAALYDQPFLEVRGVSNLVEDRDMSRWRLRDAADAAGRAVEVLVRHWSL